MATGTTESVSMGSAEPTAASSSPLGQIPADAPHISTDDVSVLRGAVLILARRLRHQQAGDELSPSEAAVMGRIGRAGPMTPGQLAKSEHVQPPSMTRIIERLAARGFLRRAPDPTDRRQVFVSRTPAGDDFVERSRAVRTAWLARQLEQLSEADQQAI